MAVDKRKITSQYGVLYFVIVPKRKKALQEIYVDVHFLTCTLILKHVNYFGAVKDLPIWFCCVSILDKAEQPDSSASKRTTGSVICLQWSWALVKLSGQPHEPCFSKAILPDIWAGQPA